MKKSFVTLFAIASVLCFASCEDDTITKTTYALDEEDSAVIWTGYSPDLYHDGSFSVSSQNIEVVDGKLKGGSFTIAIASIQNFDLPDDLKPVLVEHLKSPDFFNMAMHPTAEFKIKAIQPITNPVEEGVEGANYMVTGDFSMIGQTHTISFPARIAIEDADMELEAAFELDRTKWGMNYAADPALGEHHILPKVDIRFDLKAHRM